MRARWTGRDDGDQRAVADVGAPGIVPAGLSVRRLHQVHAADVVVVDAPPPPGTRRWETSAAGLPPDADAVLGTGTGSCVAVLTADCGPVALGSAEGVHAAVHVGWRGLLAGVVEAATEAMAALGATSVVAGLGPTIHPCCYAFGPADLDVVARAYGDDVRATTSTGETALDLPAAVRAALVAAGVELVVDLDVCTACGEGFFSHRGRGDDARQAVFVWSDRAIPVP